MSHQISPFEAFQQICLAVESFGVAMNWIKQPQEPVQNGYAAPQVPAAQPADPFAKAEPPRERKKPGRKPKGYYQTAGDAGHESIVESVEEMLIPDPEPATAAGPETEPARKKPGRKPKVRVEEGAAA
jgi:hypothetical protein